ncbi:terminase [Streptomyces griseus]
MEQSCALTTDQFYNEFTRQWQRKWAAFEVGLVVSRQNGKGSILEARELAGLFLFGERLIIHSAHQFDTSKEAFARILMLIEQTPDLDNEVARVSRSHGEEGIELKSGQRLRFRTRTKGGGRGFTGDCLILDEAMYLDSAQVGALMPTLSARPNPQLWYTGSAGDKDSTQLGRVRSRALKHSDHRLFYAEWSIDACTDFCLYDCTDHDSPTAVESYAKANPGLGIRITVEHVQSEQRSMDTETFAQERLGVGDWPVDGDQWAVISEESWQAREDEASEIEESKDGILVLAVDTSPNREFSTITACGLNGEELLHVEVTGYEQYDSLPGIQWVVPRLKELWASVKPAAVIIDKASQAGILISELEDAGIKVITPTTNEYAQACGEFYSGIVPRKGETANIVHLGQIPLTNAVAGADKRDLADKWAWSKRNSSSDISPLVSATLAVWGYRRVLFEQPQAATPWVYRR